MSHSLTGVRNPGKRSKNNLCSIDSSTHALIDGHYAECHIDPCEVVNADEVADPKNLSRRRDVQYRRSMHHSIRLNEPDNSPPGSKSISSTLGKRRAKVFFKPEYLEN